MSTSARVLLALLTGGALLAACTGAETEGPEAGPTEDAVATTGRSPAPGDLAARDSWRIVDPRIGESSGLAWGRVHRDVLYTHNDRGTTAAVFAVDDSGTLAVLRLDVAAQDWEDVATTPDGRIWVGDIGDNDLARASVEVVVVQEPDVLVSADVPSTSYQLAYPDGPHDAEALLVDPRDDRVYVVTKDPAGGRVYQAPRQLSADGVNELTRLGRAPAGVTGGDFSPDGRTVVLRSQGRAFFYRQLGRPPTVVPLPAQPQGESVAFTPDGTHVVVGSEGTGSRVLRIAVPSLEE